MKLSNDKILTPFFLKADPNMPWPEQETMFYLMTADGLFQCRNHRFFRSSVPVKDWPAELAAHRPFFTMKYPKISQPLFERVVGFFARIGDRYGAEAVALLVWNERAAQVEVIIPEQCVHVGMTWGGRVFPIDLEYKTPALPPEQQLIGDIHSHVDLPAYASAMDTEDELHRPGLHIVVGRLGQEPPDLHIEATIDGTRFLVREPEMVLAGYRRRRLDEVPQQWLDQVQLKRGPTEDRSSAFALPEGQGCHGPANMGNDSDGLGTSHSRGTEDRAIQDAEPPSIPRNTDVRAHRYEARRSDNQHSS